MHKIALVSMAKNGQASMSFRSLYLHYLVSLGHRHLLVKHYLHDSHTTMAELASLKYMTRTICNRHGRIHV